MQTTTHRINWKQLESMSGTLGYEAKLFVNGVKIDAIESSSLTSVKSAARQIARARVQELGAGAEINCSIKAHRDLDGERYVAGTIVDGFNVRYVAPKGGAA